jgi:5'(3')-deoxyribonucleotidase
MKTLRVLLDVDGVLADFVKSYLRLVYEVTGRWYEHHHVTEFNLGNALGLTADEASEVNKGIVQGWCSEIEPLTGAIEGVGALSYLADVYVVTSPWNKCPTWTYEREQWLARHFGIPHAKVLHGSAKHLVRGDVLVDDKTETCVKWQAEHPCSSCVLWKSPWNSRDAWAGVLTNDWGRLHALVKELSA